MNKYILTALFIIALSLRLGLLITFQESYRAEQADAADMDNIAVNLINGKGFVNINNEPIQSRPPGYILFLAGIYSAAGHNPVAVKAVQCIISSLSVLLIAFIALEMFNPIVALISGLAGAFYPAFIIYSNIKLTETPFMFLLLLSCYLLIKAYRTGELKYYVYLGLVHGIATLVRSTSLLFPFFLFLFILIIENKKAFIKGFLIYVLIHFSIVSIWTYRNYKVFNTFLPVTVGSGDILWLTIQENVWQGDKIVYPPVEIMFRDYPEMRDLPRHKWESIVTKKVFKYAYEHPKTYLKKYLLNNYKIWQIPVGKVLIEERSKTLADILQIFHFTLIALCFAGFILTLNNFKNYLPFNIFLIYYYCSHTLFIGTPRYRLPFEPFIIIYASFTLWKGYTLWKNRKYS